MVEFTEQTLSISKESIRGNNMCPFKVSMAPQDFAWPAPDFIEGKLLHLTAWELSELSSGGESAKTTVCARRYRFLSIRTDGTYVLGRDF
jgi:hypothetical protein